MIERNDEQSYRALLESAHTGIGNVKAFLDAIETSEIALKNEAAQTITKSAREHVEKLEQEADQLWDLFKRILRGD